ncbi:MAG: hypothetical protein OSJ83_02100 [Clostridia bacterium]|nr:hypothetical protein [Clostridia bacterium]
MTVREIACAAAAILQADDIAELIERQTESEDTDGNSVDASTDPDVKTLVKCVNLAVAELNRELPVVQVATMRADGGSVPPSAFPDGLSAVRAVKRGKAPVSFGLSNLGITVAADGEYTVEYTLAHRDGKLDDDIAVGVGADADVVCYLAARNYCLVTGRNDEASVWDQRYNAELEKRKLARRARLPRRVWT